MQLIDTHTHIYADEFTEDRQEMILRAEKEGVIKMLLPAVDAGSHTRLLELAGQYPEQCLPMMGLHPCSVQANYKEELKIAREQLETGRFYGVGEIGLDLYWDKTYTAQQVAALHEQLEWAVHFDLPVSIHSRNATAECIEVVREHQRGGLKGVFHCFSGNLDQAREIIGLGMYLGIGGVVTFKNGGLDKILDQVEPAHLVLETDAPYLAPVPFRGKRNEPAYLSYILAKLAEIQKTTVDALAEQTTENAKKLFGC